MRSTRRACTLVAAALVLPVALGAAPARASTDRGAPAVLPPLPSDFPTAVGVAVERAHDEHQAATIERDDLASQLARLTTERDARQAQLSTDEADLARLRDLRADRTSALEAMLLRSYTTATSPFAELDVTRSSDQRFADHWQRGISKAAIATTSGDVGQLVRDFEALDASVAEQRRRLADVDATLADLTRRHADAVVRADRATAGLVGDRLTQSAMLAGGPLRATRTIPVATPEPPRSVEVAVGLRAMQSYWAASVLTAERAPGCRLGWWVLAAVGQVESHHGGELTPDGVTTVAIRGPVLDGTGSARLVPDSEHGVVDGHPEFDRAVGPMQFLPGTWRTNGVDADGDGRSDPSDLDDAAAAAARYLCRGGGDLEDPAALAAAVRRYNASDVYVAVVTELAAAYRTLFDHHAD